VALRPEMTPTLARMVAAHERNYKKPIKWFAIPQLFRYERQQKGRLREHFQFNADIVGEADWAADAELIALLVDSLRSLGLTANDIVIRMSSRQAWQSFFSRRCADHSKAYAFYQVIDKLGREPREHSEQGLTALGISLEEVTQFIREAKPTPELGAVLSNLAARGLGDFVKVDYQVVRGLAYYTGMVYEAFDRQDEFRAIAGGGRYDNLVKLISGDKVNLPALGFGMGDVVVLELLKARGLLPAFNPAPDAYCLIEDETLRTESLRFIHDLRAAGCSVDYSLTPAKSDKQFKRAQEMKAVHTLRLERCPSSELKVRLKSLSTREEKLLTPAEATSQLRAYRG
jgi:histidyl-tRNA synthetase